MVKAQTFCMALTDTQLEKQERRLSPKKARYTRQATSGPSSYRPMPPATHTPQEKGEATAVASHLPVHPLSFRLVCMYIYRLGELMQNPCVNLETFGGRIVRHYQTCGADGVPCVQFDLSIDPNSQAIFEDVLSGAAASDSPEGSM